MPQRMVRDWTDSWTMQQLSSDEERFFLRLMMKADDFGRFHACPNALKSFLFPLLPDIRTEQVRKWRDTCVDVDLICLYRDEKNREFLVINKFGQRLRTMKTQFPAPCGHNGCKTLTSCQHGDVKMLAKCQHDDSILSAEEKRTEEKRTEEKGNPHAQNGSGEIPTLDEVKVAASMMGILEASAIGFWEWHEINNAWRKNGTLIKWRLKLPKWASNDKEFKTNGKRIGNSQTVDRNQGTANAGKANQYANLGRVVSNQSVR